MSSDEIRKKFLEFFKARGHAIVPSSSLIPDDPSVLLTTAGMQQFKRYYTGELDPVKDFGSKNTASIQKAFRTSDIDEVGDESHLTFFEMLGNFSFGGYFKKEAIQYAHEFITKEMGLEIDFVSIFGGDDGVPADEESERIWKSLGVINIKRFGREDNFWGPTGAEGPCGPTTEIYVNGVEIWNIVFNEYYSKNGKLEKLKTPGVDTGMGLERLAMVSQGKKNIFETDLFESLFSLLQKITPMTHRVKILDSKISFNPETTVIPEDIKRVIADHARAIVFLVADGVFPLNKSAGYVLRRLMRRYIFRMYSIGDFDQPLKCVIGLYKKEYPELGWTKIEGVFSEELSKFLKTLTIGLGELLKMETIDALSAFNLYQSYGLPYEVIKDYAGEKARSLTREDFDKEFEKHQELSRTSSAGMFKGGLADHSEKTTRLHTAHHLLLKALQIVLGPKVKQRGSNITSERLRLDFLYDEKMSDEQKKEVERIVNEKIAEDLPVIRSEMVKEEAEKIGAEHEFGQKYPERVSVYSIGPKSATSDEPQFERAFSIEFCGGPHVKHTGEIGTFKIAKEEAVGAGVRRVRGIIT